MRLLRHVSLFVFTPLIYLFMLFRCWFFVRAICPYKDDTISFILRLVLSPADDYIVATLFRLPYRRFCCSIMPSTCWLRLLPICHTRHAFAILCYFAFYELAAFLLPCYLCAYCAVYATRSMFIFMSPRRDVADCYLLFCYARLLMSPACCLLLPLFMLRAPLCSLSRHIDAAPFVDVARKIYYTICWCDAPRPRSRCARRSWYAMTCRGDAMLIYDAARVLIHAWCRHVIAYAFDMFRLILCLPLFRCLIVSLSRPLRLFWWRPPLMLPVAIILFVYTIAVALPRYCLPAMLPICRLMILRRADAPPRYGLW